MTKEEQAVIDAAVEVGRAWTAGPGWQSSTRTLADLTSRMSSAVVAYQASRSPGPGWWWQDESVVRHVGGSSIVCYRPFGFNSHELALNICGILNEHERGKG